MKTRNKQDGSVIVFVVLALAVLFGFTGLVVNVGFLTMTKSDLQTAADAGALAAAQNLANNNPIASLEAARATAINYAQKSPGKTTDIVTPQVDLKGTVSTIQVTTTRVSPGFLGAADTIVSATATARVSPAGGTPPGTPPFAIKAPSNMVWTNNVTQTYTMKINPTAPNDFTYVDVAFKNPTTTAEYYNLLTNGNSAAMNMSSPLYWIAPAEGGTTAVNSFADRITNDPNTDITKATVGEARLMMIPLLSTLPTRATDGNDWSYSTKGLAITGFVGFWLDSVYKGRVVNGTYPDFNVKGRFIQIVLPSGTPDLTGKGTYYGTSQIQLIK